MLFRSDARELARLARRLRAHVNLIPLNPTPGYAVQGSTPAAVAAFADRLLQLDVNVTVRRNRGTDIDAACGQLAAAAARTAVTQGRASGTGVSLSARGRRPAR